MQPFTEKVSSVSPDWPAVRKLEAQSRLSYRMDCWQKANANAGQFRYKLELLRAAPLYYPRKGLSRLMDAWRRA
jgi:hypothetical protein